MAADYQYFVKDAQEVSKKTGVPTSLILAAIIQESSGSYEHGLSGLAANAYNLFGIKGIGTNGSYNAATKEYGNGGSYSTVSGFRKYNNYQESIADYARLITNSHYFPYTSKANTPQEWATAIQKAGYATDPSYAQSLINHINSKNLTQYDIQTNKPQQSTVSVISPIKQGALMGINIGLTHGATTGLPVTGNESSESAIEKVTGKFKKGAAQLVIVAMLFIFLFIIILSSVKGVQTNEQTG